MNIVKQAAKRLREMLDKGRVIRSAWTAPGGRACLLAAQSEEVASSSDAGACPTDLMPQWMAHLTPWIDDRGTKTQWRGFVERYSRIADRWHLFRAEDWAKAKDDVIEAILKRAKEDGRYVHPGAYSRSPVDIANFAANTEKGCDKVINVILGALEKRCTAVEARERRRVKAARTRALKKKAEMAKLLKKAKAKPKAKKKPKLVVVKSQDFRDEQVQERQAELVAV